jgi:thiol:disulfide interchange protein
MLSASFVLALFMRTTSPALAAESPAPSPVDWSVASKRSRHECHPILIELGAPWCAACHAMDSGVLGSNDFKGLSRDLIVYRADVDDEDGKSFQKRFLAPYLPTYILIRPDGSEVGRMIGWQPDGRFLTRLSSWLKRSKETPCPSSSSKT